LNSPNQQPDDEAHDRQADEQLAEETADGPRHRHLSTASLRTTPVAEDLAGKPQAGNPHPDGRDWVIDDGLRDGASGSPATHGALGLELLCLLERGQLSFRAPASVILCQGI